MLRYPTGAPGPCSHFLIGVRVAHLLLLLCTCDINTFMFFVVYVCFPSLVFVPGLHPFDYRHYIHSLDYSYNCLGANKASECRSCHTFEKKYHTSLCAQ